MNSSQILKPKESKISNPKYYEPKTSLRFKKIKKKAKLKLNNYLGRTRTYKPKKKSVNIPLYIEESKICQILSESDESTSNSFETFNYINPIENYEINQEKSSYDIMNLSSPYSESIFGERNTVSDMSNSSKKTFNWGKIVYILVKINR